MISKKPYLLTPQINSQNISFPQATSSANFYGNKNSEIESVNNQSAEIQKGLSLRNKMKKKYSNKELIILIYLKLKTQRYFLMEVTGANFSCENLQLSFKTMQQSSYDLQSAVTSLEQFFTTKKLQKHNTEILSFRKNSI